MDAVLLAAAALLGAALRLTHLDTVSLWLDELIDYDVATNVLRHPFRALFPGLSSEHGPLFYATELAGRVFASPEISARLFPAIFGVIAIVALWLAARSAGLTTGCIAALLLALSPLHVYYSHEARPYALLMLLATVALIALVKRNPILFGAATTACMLTSKAAGPFVLSAACSAAIAAWLAEQREERKRFAIAAAVAAASPLLIPLLYHVPEGVPTAGFPGVSARFFNELLQTFTLQVLPPFAARRAAYAMLALAIAGAIALFRRNRVHATIAVVLATFPVASGIAALAIIGHWYNVRYVSAALPAWLLLVAAGIEWIAMIATQRIGRHAFWIVALAVVAAIGKESWPAAREEWSRKLDWREVASSIWNHAAPGDTVLTTNSWSFLSLQFYLQRLPPRVHLVNAAESLAIAQRTVKSREPVWIVSAGFEADTTVTGWSCAYPLLMASKREQLRIHYAPSLGHFLQHRALGPELRTIAAQYPNGACRLLADTSDAIFFASGWGTLESNGDEQWRWALGPEATVVLPVSGATDRTIRFHALPAGSSQTVEVLIDGSSLGGVAMSAGWRDYEIEAPAGVWKGDRHTLTLRFAHSAAPHDADPHSPDMRPLSAMFTSIEAGEKPANLPLHPVRMEGFLDEPPRERSRYAPQKTDPAALRLFCARAGFDPDATPAALRSGRITVEQLVDAMIEEYECSTDATFIRAAFLAAASRDPGEAYSADLAKQWHDRRERARLLHGLIETPQFPIARAK